MSLLGFEVISRSSLSLNGSVVRCILAVVYPLSLPDPMRLPWPQLAFLVED